MKEKNIKKNKKEMSIDHLAIMVQKGFAETATKDDIKDVRNEMKNLATRKELLELKNDLEEAMSRHLGTFRKDYDELAGRVRKLEDKVFTNR